MTPRDGSRLYPLAPGLYARSQSSFERWQTLNPEERQGYIEAASTTQPARDATEQTFSDRAQPPSTKP
jgi:hypothetical protein